MKRKELIKHWEIVKAFRKGKDIQYKTKNMDSWSDIVDPTFFDDTEYRIKPVFKPENGDLILVSNNNSDFFKRIFIKKTKRNEYVCVSGNRHQIINTNDKINTAKWEYAKPLNK